MCGSKGRAPRALRRMVMADVVWMRAITIDAPPFGGSIAGLVPARHGGSAGVAEPGLECRSAGPPVGVPGRLSQGTSA